MPISNSLLQADHSAEDALQQEYQGWLDIQGSDAAPSLPQETTDANLCMMTQPTLLPTRTLSTNPPDALRQAFHSWSPADTAPKRVQLQSFLCNPARTDRPRLQHPLSRSHTAASIHLSRTASGRWHSPRPCPQGKLSQLVSLALLHPEAHLRSPHSSGASSAAPHRSQSTLVLLSRSKTNLTSRAASPPLPSSLILAGHTCPGRSSSGLARQPSSGAALRVPTGSRPEPFDGRRAIAQILNTATNMHAPPAISATAPRQL